MKLMIDIPTPIAEALAAMAQRSGLELRDLAVEALRQAPFTRDAIANAYPPSLAAILGDPHDRKD